MKKIKITKVGSKIRPLYQQDPKTFALDTGGFATGQEWEEGDFRTQYPEVDEDEANVEAERGENILTPEMENYSIGGDKHYNGGTFLAAEPGSFIFSNDKSLKIKGSVLEEFGINPESKQAKKGITPADIAKRYKTNKFLDILRDPKYDDIDRDTANITLSGMKEKLHKLAFLQESMKGFPNGVPDMLQEEEGETEEFKKGGVVPKYQPGGQSGTRRRPGRRPDETIEEYNRRVQYSPTAIDITGSPGAWINNGNQQAPTPIIPSGDPKRTPTDKLVGTRRRPPRMAGESQQDYEGRVEYRQDAIDIYGTPGAWINYGNKTLPGVTVTGNRSASKTPGTAGIPGTGVGTKTVTGIGTGVGAGAGTGDLSTFSDQNYDVGYGDIDLVNMASPYAIGLRKYNPIRININPQSLQFNPIDLEAQRQAIRGQISTAQEASNILSGSSAQASARNAQLLAAGLDPLNQSYMTEFNANQAARTQIEAQNAQFRQQANQLNAAANDQYNERTALTNENYDNERRLRLKSFLKAWNVAERSRQVKNAGNVINEDFMTTANGQIVRKLSSYDQARQYARLTGTYSGEGGQMTFDQYKAALPPDVASSSTPWELWKAYQNQMSATYRGKDANNVTVSSRNPYLIPQPYEYSTYPQ